MKNKDCICRSQAWEGAVEAALELAPGGSSAVTAAAVINRLRG